MRLLSIAAALVICCITSFAQQTVALADRSETTTASAAANPTAFRFTETEADHAHPNRSQLQYWVGKMA